MGTALPVIGFTLLMVFAAQSLGKALDRLTLVEKWVRVLAGLAFIVAGVFYTLTVIYGVKAI